MTQPVEWPSVTYTADGVVRTFDFNFYVPPSPEGVSGLNVHVTKGLIATLVPSTDYTITLLDRRQGGRITFNTAPTPGLKVTIQRETPLSQTRSFQNGVAFFAEEVEGMGDRSAVIDQEQAETLSRAVVVPIGSEIKPVDLVSGLHTDSLNAEASRIAAEQARDDTESIRNWMAERYQISDEPPLTRPDGTPLQKGDMYFNTVKGSQNVWEGTRWLPVVSSETLPLATFDELGVIRYATAQQILNGSAESFAVENNMFRTWAVQRGLHTASSQTNLDQFSTVGFITSRPGVVGHIDAFGDNMQGLCIRNSNGYVQVGFSPQHLDRFWIRSKDVTTNIFTDWKMIAGAQTGMIQFFPFRPDDLSVFAPGWYFCNGDQYALTSPQGNVLNAFPEGFSSDWGITITDENISLPNLFHSDGRGYFVRAADGTTQTIGQSGVQGDAIRNITGSVGEVLLPPDDISGNPFHTVTVQYPRTWSVTGSYSGYVVFDASRAVPTAEEIRPINIGMTPAIYLGV